MRHKLLLLLPLLAFTADTWQPFAVDPRVVVQLPAQPTEVNLAKLTPGQPVGRTRLWTLRAPEGIYLILRLPGAGHISKADIMQRADYYKGVLSAVLQDEHGQFISQTSFPTAGGAGAEFKYKGLQQGTNKSVIKYMRALVLDSIGYSLLFQPADKADSTGTAGATQRRRFFDSITVKP